MGSHTYQLTREQVIPCAVEEVFQFFADAGNLEMLTPPWLNFEILTPGRIKMHTGTIIQYALKVHQVPVHWTTTISEWNPPYEFVDVQLRGPYVLWHHRHEFQRLGNETRMIDEIHYRLPLGWIGRATHQLFVARDLRQIFDYRARIVDQQFRSTST